MGGNQVLIVEAVDQRPSNPGGSAITLCDRDGAPVVICRVDPAGHLVIEVHRERD